MLHIDKSEKIEMYGSDMELFIELAQLLVSYQYMLDKAENKPKRDPVGFLDLITEVGEFAINLYMDDTYNSFLGFSDSKVIDVTGLNKALKKLKQEET